jgi:hypothetical protein
MPRNIATPKDTHDRCAIATFPRAAKVGMALARIKP